jgi:hypothetical protein
MLVLGQVPRGARYSSAFSLGTVALEDVPNAKWCAWAPKKGPL